jgi:gliding motility-associated-like protein
LTIGQDYWISVDDDNTPGTFSLCLNDQVDYDYKAGAVLLANTNNWCSSDGAYDNTFATADESMGSCWSGAINKNVWFKFAAVTNFAKISVNTGSGYGTMVRQQFALWDAPGTLIGCTKWVSNQGTLTLQVNTLNPGQDYWISVDDDNTSGTFSLCINSSPLGVNVTSTNVTCFGLNDGTATAVPSGGTAPYTYLWTGPGSFASSSSNITNLIPGTYNVTVTDFIGDFVNGSAVITQPAAALSGSTVVTNVSCFGGSDGAVNLTVLGGTAPYTFLWSNGATTEDISGLTSGNYTVVITDSKGCTANAAGNVTQSPSALSGSITSQTNVSASGGNDGSVTVDGSGGTPAYQYKLGSGIYQVSGTFGTLIAGSYTVTVQDINLCTFDVAVTITQPVNILTGSITSQTDVACFGTSTGSVTVAGSGGVAPYEYKLDAGSYQSSGTFGALAAGTYTVTVRDALLNVFDVNITITQPASSVGGSITSQTNVLCFGNNTGSVTVEGSGGTSPYQYKLGAVSYQGSGTFGTLTSGSYTVTVQDANLCTFDVPVTITQPALAFTGNITTQTNVLCFGSSDGSVTLTGAGGTTPYQYSLNGGPYQLSGTFTGLTVGTHDVTVIDANLCTASVPFTITEPLIIAVDPVVTNATCPDEPDGSITLIITGGTQPYNVIWSDGTSTQNRTGLTAATYSLVATDINGCSFPFDVTVGFTGSDNCLVIPQIITPNNDGYNDTWVIKNIDLFPNAEVKVFNRWGKLVFRTKNISANPWDGVFKGEPLPTDSYHYVLNLNDGSDPRSGAISIIR